MLSTRTPLLAETVRKLVARGAHANAFNILSRLHPSDIASILGELSEHLRRDAFQNLHKRDIRLASAAISELGPERGASLLSEMTSQEISVILQELDPDDAAVFVPRLPPELQEEILGAMRKKEASDVEDLLQYPDQTAGRIMSPKVFSLNQGTTVEEAIRRLQDAGDLEMVFYIYVVDDHGNLVGVLSLRQLLLKRPHTKLADIMEPDVIRVATDTDQEEVAQLVASYNLLAIPVVDSLNKLVGVITVDDVIDVIKEEATEDMYRLAGLDREERVFTRPSTSVAKRIPWLVLNLGTAFIAALVVSLFENTISQFALLAVFMPVVPLLGGNAGNQTLTVMVRGIALGELSWSNSRKALFKEVLVGIVNGITIGLLVGLAAFLWKGNPWLGVVLSLAMVGTLLVAAVMGTLIPLALRWLKVDPALASSVFVTTATDVTGFLLFLGLGALFLSRFQ
ncbi:MAG TPA: magnesium transporter [Vicinamibacteria bacterium]|nr:magnesium transporter [Vicinamibacteria bacterium]